MRRKATAKRWTPIERLGDAISTYLRTDGWTTVMLRQPYLVPYDAGARPPVYEFTVQFTGFRPGERLLGVETLMQHFVLSAAERPLRKKAR